MFNHKENIYFIVFEILLLSFSSYQISAAIVVKTNKNYLNQINIEFKTAKENNVNANKIQLEYELEAIKKNNYNISKMQNQQKIEKNKRKKIINNQIISFENDDADIIWFNED